MVRHLALTAALLMPALLSAQEGTIAYQHSVEIEMPPEMRERLGNRMPRGFPSERVDEVVLFFNANESLMKPVPRGERTRGEGPEMGDRARLAARLRNAGPRGAAFRARMGRAANETVVEAHVRYDENTMVEQREFLGRKFLIVDERPALQWRLTTEQAAFLDHPVQKATAERDGRAIEAWFTTQIPVSGGPAGYGGLPGMILVVSIDDGREQYNATAISLVEIADDVIVEPSEGERVTREEYEAVVAEKLEELRAVGGENDR